jgi:hypothetical protein
VLAFRARGDFSEGIVPLYEMPALGGTRRMRGVIYGRFRDLHAMSLATEYRFPIWALFWGGAFAEVGEVFGGISDLRIAGLHYSLGGGPRLSLPPSGTMDMRLDFAFADAGWSFFVVFGQAF